MANIYEYQIDRGLAEARRLAMVYGGFVLMFAWYENGNEQVSLYFVHCDGKQPNILRLMRTKAYGELTTQDPSEERVVVIVVSDNPDFPVGEVIKSIRQFASLN